MGPPFYPDAGDSSLLGGDRSRMRMKLEAARWLPPSRMSRSAKTGRDDVLLAQQCIGFGSLARVC